MKKSLSVTKARHNPDGYWSKPIEKLLYIPTCEDVALFDQNGYALTDIERHFAVANDIVPKSHRRDQLTLKEDWITQRQPCIEGPVLNHCFLSERKGYTGEALEQLKRWAKTLPLLHKVIAIRPKWGMDFSMDYVDNQGNSFEILHWEWDSFSHDEIIEMRAMVEPRLMSIDWEDAAKQLLNKKDTWYNLDFFAQSSFKCGYLGIPDERFKMVIWK